MIFKTIPNETNLSGLSIDNVFSINKEAEAESAQQLRENIKRLQDYKIGIDELNKTTATSIDYNKLWNETMVGADEDVQAAAKDIKAGTGTVEAYTVAQKEAATATESVGIASKAAAVGMRALSLAANVVLITAISYGIEKLVDYFSNLKTPIQQADEALTNASKDLSDVNQKVSNTNSKLKDTNSQIEKLQSKGSLTFVEQGQLTTLQQTSQELQTQLEIQEALQKIEKEKQTKAALKSFDILNEEKINPFTGGINTDNEINAKSGIEGINQSLAFYSDRLAQINKDQKDYNELVSKGNHLTDEEKQKKETLEYILKDEDSTTLKENLLNRAKAYQEEANAIDIDSASNKKAAQEKKQSALDQANAILKIVDAENYAENQTKSFNSVWKDSSYKNEVQGLSDLAKQGKLTADALQGSKYTSFIQAMKNVGLTVSQTIIQIKALADSDSVNTTSTSLSDLTTKFTDLNTKITSLQSIQEQYNKVGYVSTDMLSTLLANNNELMQYIDIINGKMVIHTDQLNKDADSIKAQMVATEESTLASQIYGIMQDDLQGKLSDTSDATDTAKSQISDMSKAMGDAAINAATLSGAYDAVIKSFEGIPGSKTSGLSSEAKKEIEDAISNARSTINTINSLGTGTGKTTSSGTGSSKSTTSTENTALKNAESLLEYKKQMGEFDSNDLYKQIQLNQEYLKQIEALKQYAKTTDEIREINEKNKLAQDAVTTSQKNYQQDILDTSYSELENRKNLGLVEEGSVEELQNLYEIQKNLNSASMTLVNTKEHQLEIEKKIYDSQKKYQENVLTKSQSQMQGRIDTGVISENSQAALENLQEIYHNLTTNPNMKLVNDEEHRNEILKQIYNTKKGILENEISEVSNIESTNKHEDTSLKTLSKLRNIKREIIHSDLGSIDKAKELESVNEQIYSKSLDHLNYLTETGRLQENSLEYVDRLKSLYSSLNLTLSEQEELQEKIFSAEKSYISQLESNLSDENIVGSYGYRIKQIQDQIDAINNQSEAESKALAVEKAKAAWEEAQNNKTSLIYEGTKGFIYEANQQDVTEKKESYSDAKRQEDIEKLNQQKKAIQEEEEAAKASLENALRTLEGTNNQSWSNIQEQVENALNNVNKWVGKSTRYTISSYDKQDNALDESTENTQEDYQSQIDSAKDFIKQMKTIQPQILKINQDIANSNNLVANSYQNIAKALLRAAYEYSDLENNRERANERYNEYNKEAKRKHETVKYASGTESSVEGVIEKNEGNKYEAEMQPTDGGDYEWIPANSKIFTANMTKNLWNVAKNPNLFTSSLMNPNNIVKTSNVASTVKNNYHFDKLELPNVTDHAKQLVDELKTIDLNADQYAYKNK